MANNEKIFSIVLVIIFLTGHILGSIKVAGKLLIPIAGNGKKPCKGVLTITRAKIRIECNKKIFQPFNEFDTPRQSRLDINTSDLKRIEINEGEKRIYLRVKNSFVSRYRNICNLESSVVARHSTYYPFGLFTEYWALVFAYEKPLDISFLDKKILESINYRSYPVFTKHCFYSP